jgi:hypothetical protein
VDAEPATLRRVRGAVLRGDRAAASAGPAHSPGDPGRDLPTSDPAVTRATYLQLWWPPFDQPVYVDAVPSWDPEARCYRDPDTGAALPAWEEALDRLDGDQDAAPAAVVRLGNQIDIKGIIASSADADRSVRYLAKYLTKAVADTYTDAEHLDQAYEAHIDRLHQILLFVPCSPECGNWPHRFRHDGEIPKSFATWAIEASESR